MAPNDKFLIREAASALGSNDRDALKTLYQLTSKQLYGKLLSQLQHEALAAEALKATYADVWRNRAEVSRSGGQVFQLIAAIAHRRALEIRFRTVRAGQDIASRSPAHLVDTSGHDGVEPIELDEQDGALLKAAYLSFEDPGRLGERHGMAADDVRSHLARLASPKTGGRDE